MYFPLNGIKYCLSLIRKSHQVQEHVKEGNIRYTK